MECAEQSFQALEFIFDSVQCIITAHGLYFECLLSGTLRAQKYFLGSKLRPDSGRNNVARNYSLDPFLSLEGGLPTRVHIIASRKLFPATLFRVQGLGPLLFPECISVRRKCRISRKYIWF